MRKYIFILTCLVYTVSARAIEVAAGARVGLNLAHIRKMEAMPGYDKKLMPGSNFGGLVRVNFNDFIGLQAELLFSQKGQRWAQKTDSIQYFNKLVTNYLEFPVLAVARVGSDKIKGVFYLGAYFGYWTGGYMQTSAQLDKQTISSSHTGYTFTKNDRRFDAGLATGAGVEIKAGPGAVEIAVRHSLGLADRSKDNGPHTKTYNCNLFISAAYLFTFGK